MLSPPSIHSLAQFGPSPSSFCITLPHSSVISVSGHHQHSSSAMDPCPPFFHQNSLPRAAQNQSSAVKSLVKQVFKALDPWLSTPCPCNGIQPSTTPTAQIQHPAPLNPNQPSPCLVSPKQEQQEQPGFPRAQPQPKKKWQHLPRSFCPAAPMQQHMRKVLWATELLRCCPNPAYRLPTGHPQYALKNHPAKET